MEERDVIVFTTEEGEQLELYILEQTKLNGMNYLLVADTLDDEDDDVEVYIMKETKEQEEGEYTSYEFVEDEEELTSIGKVFEELLEDTDIEV